MNIWVEYWEVLNTKSGSHAQMSKNPRFIEPDPKIISRRFFSTWTAAAEFTKIIEKEGKMARIKQDRSL